MIPRKHLMQAFAAGVLALTAATASADAIITMTRPGNIAFASPGGGLVQIGPGLFTTPNFANAFNQRFMVLYTAECTVYNTAAGNSSVWLDLDVEAVNVITGVITRLPPTVGVSDAFCTSNGTAAGDGWTMAAVNAVSPANMPAGTYRIQLRGRIQNGVGTGHLGDSSLTVWR